MEPGIGKLFDEDKELFEDLARQWTWKYAMHEFVTIKNINWEDISIPCPS